MLTESKYMLIRQAIFYCELFSWLIFWLSARSSILLMLASLRALRTAWMTTYLPSVERLDTARRVIFSPPENDSFRKDLCCTHDVFFLFFFRA